MAVNLIRVAIALIFCWVAGKRLGKLTSGLSPNDQLWARVIGLLLIVAGLLLPAP